MYSERRRDETEEEAEEGEQKRGEERKVQVGFSITGYQKKRLLRWSRIKVDMRVPVLG